MEPTLTFISRQNADTVNDSIIKVLYMFHPSCSFYCILYKFKEKKPPKYSIWKRLEAVFMK